MKLTTKQREARKMLGGDETHCLLFGGSRSGKTFLLVRAIVARALMAPASRHAILRFRFNHVKASIIHDTLPKVMKLCWPGIQYSIDKTDWFMELPNGSQIWFGGLDDKERTEKILGQEYATIYLNECSQIPYGSRNLAITRLAQKVEFELNGEKRTLRLKIYYDCNPPSQSHWTYFLWVRGIDPETKKPIDTGDHCCMVLNPQDNSENLPVTYIKTLEGMPERLKTRFLYGKFADITEGALWTLERLELNRRINDLPDMQRVVVAVDPSGSDDTDNLANDEIGIVVAGLGVDGNGYVLEDLTCKAGPATWGRIATTAFDRHSADKIVAEKNYGGAMVKHVIQTARKQTPYADVNATRGKVIRAEPVSALEEQGRIRHGGRFNELEDELTSFTTAGYLGADSPNRADAYVWAMTYLFGDIVNGPDEAERDIEFDSLFD